MNALAQTFVDYSRALLGLANIVEKPVPLAADLFEWCRETNNYRHIEWAMSMHGVRFERAMPLSELKARVGRFVDREAANVKRKKRLGRPYDLNGLIAFQQMQETIEQFERTV